MLYMQECGTKRDLTSTDIRSHVFLLSSHYIHVHKTRKTATYLLQKRNNVNAMVNFNLTVPICFVLC